MGYTHYWHQPKNFTVAAWTDVCGDIQSILNDVQHVQGVPLANAGGEPGTQPEVTRDFIYLNGLGPNDLGYYDVTTFVGSPRDVPKGWKIIGFLGTQPETEGGLA